MSKLSAFECRLRGMDGASIINQVSAGKARYEFLLEVRECYPGATFADVAVRRLGPPQPTRADEIFARVARYRGLPDLRRGDTVRLISGDSGVVVGTNSSANFNVFFAAGQYAGLTLNVHPGDFLPVDPS